MGRGGWAFFVLEMWLLLAVEVAMYEMAFHTHAPVGVTIWLAVFGLMLTVIVPPFLWAVGKLASE